MLHRLRWFGAGTALGIGASVWAQRKLKAAAARYRPAGVAGTAVGKARSWPAHVRAAIDEGRSTMRQREAALRQELEGDPAPPNRPPGSPSRDRPAAEPGRRAAEPGRLRGRPRQPGQPPLSRHGAPPGRTP
jgi:hypothetical protein